MKNVYFMPSAGMLLPNMVMSIFGGLQLFCFCVFPFVLLYIHRDNLSIKSINALLPNIGRVRLINFVTANL